MMKVKPGRPPKYRSEEECRAAKKRQQIEWRIRHPERWKQIMARANRNRARKGVATVLDGLKDT
jgi:phosphatidylserine/phosphatidylglycerophosphate/cardiolipin synthase-like enzyme